MTFEPGQKVVCVDADDAPQLTLKAIYTIKAISVPFMQNWRGVPQMGCAVLLHEAKPHEGYFGFAEERFRPITSRRTDISVFEEMLKDVTIEA